MRVLVTGGLGCVGSQLARAYLDAGHSVAIIDACESKRNEWTCDRLLEHVDDPLKVRIYQRRLEKMHGEDRGFTYHLREYLHSVDVVIHAAASTGIPHSAEHPDDDWVSNVDATKVLLDALRECPKPTVILSSVKPYRTTFPREPNEWYAANDGKGQPPQDNQMRNHGGLKEDDPLEPDEPYAASKAAQSMLAMAWARTYDLPVVTLRCSNLYGPGACHGPRHGWLTWFCISAAIGRPLEVQGGGGQARDMLHGSDVYRACEAALSNARRLAGKVFNVGGGAPNVISVREAAERLRERSGCEIVEGPGRRHEDQLVFVDHSAFTEATGWRPLVGVAAGMAGTYEWAREHAEELRAVYEGV